MKGLTIWLHLKYNQNMSIEYRQMLPGEEVSVCNLIEEVFNEFIAPDYTEFGIQEFFEFANPQYMKVRVEHGNYILVALDGNKLIGIIEIDSNNHISLLFVKTDYQKRGIGRKLLELSINYCQRTNPSLGYIDVNSSPYAIEIYKKLGFLQMNTQQEVNGVRFTPLKLIIK